jgi:APA family basic amino acid/polyamine antiporter
MIYGLGWTNWMRLLVWLLIGLVIYFSYGRRHSKVQAMNASLADPKGAPSMAD